MYINAIDVFRKFAEANSDRISADMHYRHMQSVIESTQVDKDRPPEEIYEMQERALFYVNESNNSSRAMATIAYLCEDYYKPYMALYTMITATRYIHNHILAENKHLIKFVPENIDKDIREILGVSEEMYMAAVNAASSDLGFKVESYDGPLTSLFNDPDDTSVGEDVYALHLTVDALERYTLVNKGREVPTLRMIRGLQTLIDQGGFSASQSHFCFTIWHLYIAYSHEKFLTKRADSQTGFDIHNAKLQAYEEALLLIMQLAKGMALRGFLVKYIYHRMAIRYNPNEPTKDYVFADYKIDGSYPLNHTLSQICQVLNVDMSVAIDASDQAAIKMAERHETEGGVFGIKDVDFRIVK